MRVMAIRYVHDVDSARRFYQALGLTTEFASRRPRRGGPPVWTELAGSGPGANLALHHSVEGPAGSIELSFQADEPLEQVVDRLRGSGYEPATEIVDEAFGRSFTIRDPEGLLIQVNENDHELQR
ncbi:MAG TPA: VOC family protein [Streptosporangiaceae bacterium]|nr:VOC family protein [Streptosporangiaceae bacterium]